LTFNIEEDQSISAQSEILVTSERSLTIKVKSKKAINTSLQKQINTVALRLGFAPFGLKLYSDQQLTFNKYRFIQLTTFFNSDSLTKDGWLKDGQTKFNDILTKSMDQLITKTGLGQIFRKEQFQYQTRLVNSKTSMLMRDNIDEAQNHLDIDKHKLEKYFETQDTINQHMPVLNSSHSF
jgi:hypothetical protein